MVKGLEAMTYGEQLRMVGLFSLEKSRLQDYLIAVYTFVMRGRREGDADFSSLVSGDRT